MKGFTKKDVEFHREGFHGRIHPAVNQKVYKSLTNHPMPIALGSVDNVPQFTHPEFTQTWIEKHTTDDERDGVFWYVCSVRQENINEEAGRIFGDRVKVWSEGRNGGWAVVDGLPEFDSWDAIMVSKWGRFAKFVKACAEGIPEDYLLHIYCADFLPWLEAKEDEETSEAEIAEARY